MKWDKDGDTLAAITEKSNLIYLWSANTQKTNMIDTPPKYSFISMRIIILYSDFYLRDYTTVLAWARSSAYLAIGTSRGNVILYDQTTAK